LTPRARNALGLLVLLQIAHSAEEYAGRLWISFPPARLVTGLVSQDLERGFIIVNTALILFGLWCWLGPARLGWRSARPSAWMLAAIALINGIGHPMWSLYRGAYTPGVATAPFILIAGIVLVRELLRGDPSVVRRGHSSLTVRARPVSNSIKTILIEPPWPELEPFNNELPLLTPSENAGEREWLERTLTTFARNVASFLPGGYEAYVRIYHPFRDGSESGYSAKRWSELAASAGIERIDGEVAGEIAYNGLGDSQPDTGRRPEVLVEPLIEALRPATTTPDRCFFAVWEGFGDSVAQHFVAPGLRLPHRNYHVFEGPVEASRTSFSDASFIYTAANLWWPADRAWFVSTEVDAAWTYVGGSRTLIATLLDDTRLDSVEVQATDRW